MNRILRLELPGSPPFGAPGDICRREGRVLAVAGGGILDAPDGSGLRADQPSFPEIYKAVNREHLGTWSALRESDRDWTLVCAPDLVDGERTGVYRVLPDLMPPGARRISVEDTAAFMLTQLGAADYRQRRVGLAY